jgi:hypothetical protein
MEGLGASKYRVIIQPRHLPNYQVTQLPILERLNTLSIENMQSMVKGARTPAQTAAHLFGFFLGQFVRPNAAQYSVGLLICHLFFLSIHGPWQVQDQ